MSLFSSSLQDYTQSEILGWLSSVLNLNPGRVQQVLSVYESLAEAVEDNFAHFDIAKNTWLKKWLIRGEHQTIESFVDTLRMHEVRLLTSLDKDYPEKLRILSDYPVVLYYQGNLDLLQQSNFITIVGSRNSSKYAEIVLTNILPSVCQLGIGVVSGLAVGIDGLAHRIAVENKASTIGVIGSGLDTANFYPSIHWGLKQSMVETGGLVISEYAPGTAPSNYSFPQRNRILAALSEITWVVQAGLKSGSLITAHAARDLGKTVATTPGSIFEATLAGNLKLLKDGASLISQSEDIFDLLGLSTHPEIQLNLKKEFGSQVEEKIYNLLSLEPQVSEDLAKKLELEVTDLSMNLTMLELSGLAIHIGENQWIRGA